MSYDFEPCNDVSAEEVSDAVPQNNLRRHLTCESLIHITESCNDKARTVDYFEAYIKLIELCYPYDNDRKRKFLSRLEKLSESVPLAHQHRLVDIVKRAKNL